MGEALCQKHDVCRYEEEGVLRYGVPGYLGAFLCILKRVDVLGYTLHVLMLVLNLILQC